MELVFSTNSLAATDAFSAYSLTHKHKKHYIKTLGFDVYEFRPYAQDSAEFFPRMPLLIDEKKNGGDKDGQDHIDWDWLLGVTPAHDTKWIRHIRLEHSLTIKCEGKNSTGIVMYREDVINSTCATEDKEPEL